jgi:hypothetical protein
LKYVFKFNLADAMIVSGGSHSLKSAFVLAAPSPAPVTAPAKEETSVTLFFAKQTSDPVTGLQDFSWNTDNPTPNSVMLEHTASYKGRSKLVFKVCYTLGTNQTSANFESHPAQFQRGGLCCEALLHIGSGAPISIIANRDQLVKEGITLGRTKYFLENFNKECDNESIEISGVSPFPHSNHLFNVFHRI